MDESLSVTLTLAGILDFLEVRWFLGGSLASSVHGIPRATLDADIVADLRPATVTPLLKALGEDWYVEEQSVRGAIAERSSFNSTQLDFGTMQASANELGVTDLMVKALAEAGLR